MIPALPSLAAQQFLGVPGISWQSSNINSSSLLVNVLYLYFHLNDINQYNLNDINQYIYLRHCWALVTQKSSEILSLSCSNIYLKSYPGLESQPKSRLPPLSFPIIPSRINPFPVYCHCILLYLSYSHLFELF